MTLFEKVKTNQPPDASGVPLADRMRPRTLDEFVGQEHLVGKGKILREIIEREIIRKRVLKAHMGLYGRFKPEHFDEGLL